jgi:hypothetical protein
MRIVKHGGNLQIGDFVAISYATGFTFGWYCGEGKNTLHYFEYQWPYRRLNYYNQVKQDPAYIDHNKANSEEFDKSWITKSYVKDWRWRVMKIENPESIFTEQEDLNNYKEAKQILEQIKFI